MTLHYVLIIKPQYKCRAVVFISQMFCLQSVRNEKSHNPNTQAVGALITADFPTGGIWDHNLPITYSELIIEPEA